MLVCGACLGAASQTGGYRTLEDILSKLSVLEGPVLTYYPQGQGDRARQVEQLMLEATSYYQTRTDEPLTVRVVLVGQADLAGANPPFAAMLPATSPGPVHTVVLPFGPGHALDRAVRHVVLSSAVLRGLGRTADELSDRFVALGGLHELGHRYARAGMDPAPGWYSEFLASYLVYSFLADRRPDDARLWRIFCAAALELFTPHTRPVGDSHSGALPGDYAWYLGSLQQRVSEVHARYGRDFPALLKAAVRQRESDRDWESAMRLLEQASPGFRKWSRQHHRND